MRHSEPVPLCARSHNRGIRSYHFQEKTFSQWFSRRSSGRFSVPGWVQGRRIRLGTGRRPPAQPRPGGTGPERPGWGGGSETFAGGLGLVIAPYGLVIEGGAQVGQLGDVFGRNIGG